MNLTSDAEAIADAQPLVFPALAPALVAALKDLTIVATGRSVNTGAYSYDYANIGDVVKATRSVLADHGLVALTPIHNHGGELACTVVLLHTSGERMDLGPFPFPHGRDAQATGSAVTYHRRFALVAALGMAAGDDDDGATAKPRQPAFEWTAAAVKADLLNLCEGDKDKAKAVWTDAHGDTIVPAAGVAARLFDIYEHLPAEGETA